ncbi:GNAT family N-acetyltransferase [Cohnella rhizosphaerae]|uniref:GNAT family N-acetyltransferase n=1 Tax=Cohnella rhizosphaerae TaxID=1457232 RepID=A0A9X4QVU7_9BACL|nr:GNAT family N-acetyltransferase [Cohnella rhizosphaerae]MDG0812833.1 GNAT family N-acetyltransferase [Cohnella rhizosphaerae]
MNFTFRTLEPDDHPIICKFPQNELELFSMFPAGKYPLTPEQIVESVKSRLNPTVVLQDKTVVGYANFYGLEENAKCFLGNVIVNPANRGKGASVALVHEMIRQAKVELKVGRLQLICHNTNITGLLFYKKNGI